MGQVTVQTCDHCGRRADNIYTEPGWIRLGAASGGKSVVTRSTGTKNASGFVTDYISGVTDFCSLVCLTAALDCKASARATAEAKAAATPVPTCACPHNCTCRKA